MSATGDFITAAQSLAAALLAACFTPADAVRLMGLAASFQPGGMTSTAPVGAAVASARTACGDLFRRACISALARAAMNYHPSSADDAVRIRDFVTGVIDVEITIAGDEGQDSSYNSLVALRVAVVQLLNSRGGALPPLKTFTFNAPIPSLVLAHRIYGDASRADELTQQADPPHPAFMPANFRALAA